MLTATNLGIVAAEYSPMGPHAAGNLGLTMVDPNPMLGYVMRDEGPYMHGPLAGVLEASAWLYNNKKPPAIGAGILGVAAIAYSLLR